MKYGQREIESKSHSEPSSLNETLSEKQLRSLVDGLTSLVEGEAAAELLSRCGPRAIPIVSDFLRHGRLASVNEPRRRAVRVLASLDATEELIAYLESERQDTDDVLRFSEEGVQSLAAEVLARWPTERVFHALLEVAQKRRLIGLCVAFGMMRRPEAVPLLIRDLGDGFCGRPAMEALSQIGHVALPALNFAARSREMNEELETPSSLQRRRFAMRLLTSMGIAQSDWELIRPLSHDDDPEICAYACITGLSQASDSERVLLASRMLQVAGQANWFVKSEIQEAMLRNYRSLGWLVRQYAGAKVEHRDNKAQRFAQGVLIAANDPLPEMAGKSQFASWSSRIRKLLLKRKRKQNANG